MYSALLTFCKRSGSSDFQYFLKEKKNITKPEVETIICSIWVVLQEDIKIEERK